MKLSQAIALLRPYHTAQLVCINPDSSQLFPTGQLSTGNCDYPFIAVDNGYINSEDLYQVLESYIAIDMPTARLTHSIVGISTYNRLQSFCMN